MSLNFIYSILELELGIKKKNEETQNLYGLKTRKKLTEAARQIKSVDRIFSRTESFIEFYIGTSGKIKIDFLNGKAEIFDKGKEISKDVKNFCKNLTEFLLKFYSDYMIKKLIDAEEVLRNKGYVIENILYHTFFAEKNGTKIGINTCDLLYVYSSSYKSEEYEWGFLVKGEMDDEFESDVKLFLEKIKDTVEKIEECDNIIAS